MDSNAWLDDEVKSCFNCIIRHTFLFLRSFNFVQPILTIKMFNELEGNSNIGNPLAKI